MSKFKVGERVEVRWFGKWKKGTIRPMPVEKLYDYYVEFDDVGVDGDDAGYFEVDFLRPIQNETKILITTPQTDPLNTAKERYALADKMCKMGACSPNSKRKNTCPFVGIDKGGFGCLIYAVACPETQKIMEDYLAAEQDKPAEPKQVVKLYCVKDFRPFPDCAFGLTKGKVYTFENGDVKVDEDNTCAKYASYGDFKKRNPNYAACLVPLVSRPAKVGEWVYVLYTSYGGDLISGDIAQVISARKTGSVMIAKDRDYYPNGLCYLQSEYLVLSGYKEE